MATCLSLLESKYLIINFSNPFKSYLDEDAFYNFMNSMIKESKYCSDVMEKHFNKKLVVNKEVLIY